MRINRIGIGIVLTIVVSVLVAGCYYDNEEELYPGTECDTSNITYTSHVKAIMTTNCAYTGCHVGGGAAPGILDNYAGVMEKVNDGTFFKRTLEDKDMPPSGPLSDCNQAILTAWINDGAPE